MKPSEKKGAQWISNVKTQQLDERLLYQNFYRAFFRLRDTNTYNAKTFQRRNDFSHSSSIGFWQEALLVKSRMEIEAQRRELQTTKAPFSPAKRHRKEPLRATSGFPDENQTASVFICGIPSNKVCRRESVKRMVFSFIVVVGGTEIDILALFGEILQ